MPCRVKPVFELRVIAAVYTVEALKNASSGNHATVPVYCAVSNALTGSSPVSGALRLGISAMSMITG